jgi:hypothetical protein
MRAVLAQAMGGIWSHFPRWRGNSSTLLPGILIQMPDENIKSHEQVFVSLRNKIEADLFVRHHGSKVFMTPFAIPGPGAWLQHSYDYVVTGEGLGTEPLKDVYRNCMQFEKFASPPCLSCKWDTCLQESGSPLVVKDMGMSLTLGWGDNSKYEFGPYDSHNPWIAGETARRSPVPVPRSPMQLAVSEEASAQMVSKLKEAIQGTEGLSLVPNKWALLDKVGVSENKIYSIQDISLEERDLENRKAELSANSSRAAATRKVRKDVCSQCVISGTCNKYQPTKCSGALTLEDLQDRVKDRVKKTFGEIPTKDTPWIKMTLAASGHYIDGRIGTRKGRATTYTICGVFPTLAMGGPGDLVVRLRRKRYARHQFIHVDLKKDWSTWKPEELQKILDLPHKEITDDQAVWLAYLMSLSGWRRPYGSWDEPWRFWVKDGKVTMRTHHYRHYEIENWEDCNIPGVRQFRTNKTTWGKE